MKSSGSIALSVTAFDYGRGTAVVFRPKFISFDCYGTMINFIMGPTARDVFADRVAPSAMDDFLGSGPIKSLAEQVID
ncbi:hypothetical protein [Sphingobium abikonense]|uniref:hypothetical protein n=1 Tax=Sphingobium abikonense TaxID=86193 RepID=UPI003515608D